MASSGSKRKPPPLGAVFVVLAVLVMIAGGFWMYRDAQETSREEARAVADVPSLPAGSLRLLRSGVKESRFLALDSMVNSERGVEAQVLVISTEAGGLEGGASMTSQRKRFVCDQQRVFDGNAGHFDAEGRLVRTQSFFNGQRGRPINSSEDEAKAVCGFTKPGAALIATGFRAAQREVQMPPENYGEGAEARADEPHVWAWLCTAGARRRWREATPADCDKAVRLNPDAPDCAWIEPSSG